MIKRLSISCICKISLFIIIPFLTVFLNTSTAFSTSKPKKKKIKIKIASVAPEGTPWANGLEDIKKRITKAAKKKVKVKLLLGGIMGGEENHITSLQKNKIQGIAVSLAPYSRWIPEAFILDMPFLFMSNKEVDYITEEVFLKPLQKIFEKNGFYLTLLTENGWRSFGTTNGPVDSMEKIKTLKIVSYQTKLYTEMWKLFGAKPIPAAVTEVLKSLETDVCNSVENSPLYMIATSWHTGVKYFTLTRHIYSNATVAFSKKAVDELPPEVAEVIKNGLTQVGGPVKEAIRTITPQLINEMKNSGVQIIELDKKKRLEFAKSSKSIRDKLAKLVGPSGKKHLVLIEKALIKFRNKNK